MQLVATTWTSIGGVMGERQQKKMRLVRMHEEEGTQNKWSGKWNTVRENTSKF